MSVFLNLRQDGSMALFIDGDLQFDQRDEKIYHQGLALPALHLASGRVDKQKDLRALIVGGGDGLTARELLKSQSLTKIDLVDYSAEVLDLAGKQLAHINQMSLADERVNVHMRDAWLFVQEALEQGAQYDLIIVDLTVAKDAVGSKFHSVDWYRSIALLLASDGILATNGVSPTNTPLAYWSIFNSMLKAGLVGLPYRLAIPSFSQLGYGPDWGFILASKTPINGDEFIQWSEHQARSGSGSVLDNMFANQSQLESLFLFPIDFVKLQKEALANEIGSNIFIQYMHSDKPYCASESGTWSSLDWDQSGLSFPHTDGTSGVLPEEIRYRLADKASTIYPAGEQELFDEVLNLMPALQPAHTRDLIADFIRDPAAFLEALDIRALVNKLVKRAAELPPRIAGELKALQEKLVDWAGDYEALLDLGRRVVTTLAVVVILANFVFPDNAYGKGGGHGGYRGGGHYGRMGNSGWNHHWGNNRGRYGGWGRPNHWNSWGYGGYGYGGNPYCYAAGPAYIGTNYSSNQVPDSQGNQYPVRAYVQTYGNVPDQPWIPPAGGATSGADTSGQADGASTAVNATVLKSAYRLGPDVDVLTDGTTVIPLTDNAYLKINAKVTDLIDQKTGHTIISLYSDPSLTWHISSELQQQSKGLKKASQSKDIAGGAEEEEEGANLLPPEVVQTAQQPTADGKDATEKATEKPSDEVREEGEGANMVTTAKLLDKAEQTLGEAAEKPPEGAGPPVAGAFELFNSAWADHDGKYVILKKADGSLVYLDGKSWYSDQGTTKLDTPYPTKIKAVVTAYLSGLSKDTKSTSDSLAHEEQEVQTHLDRLNGHLTRLQTTAVAASAGTTAPVATGDSAAAATAPDSAPSGKATSLNTAAGATLSASASQPSEQDLVQFGTKKIPRAEAIKRLEGLIARAKKRLDSVQKEISNLPAETDSVKKLLINFQS